VLAAGTPFAMPSARLETLLRLLLDGQACS
jgi:hypothetical protein